MSPLARVGSREGADLDQVNAKNWWNIYSRVRLQHEGFISWVSSLLSRELMFCAFSMVSSFEAFTVLSRLSSLS